MPWKTMDVREQRVSFVATASRGERSFAALEKNRDRRDGPLFRRKQGQTEKTGTDGTDPFFDELGN